MTRIHDTPRQTINPAQLTRDLGGKWHRSYGVAPCPVCQPQRRKDQDALGVTVKGGRLLLNCKKSGCDFKDILIAAGLTPAHVDIDHLAMEHAAQQQAEQAAKSLARARSMWGHGSLLAGTHGETYLRGRGITCPLPGSLRWLPDTYHGPSGQYCGAMVASVSTGGVHRTFFTKKGERLAKSAKMMLGPCAGGAVCLSAEIGPLVICEGIETGLSLLCGLLDGPHTVWAALSTSGIKGLVLPPRPGALIIATDSDDSGAGHEAGNVLARSAHALGWGVSLMPAPDGLDWNDALQRGVVA